MLRSYLIRHVLDLNTGPTKAPEASSEPASVAPPSAPPEASDSATITAGDQLASLAGSLTPAFASGDLDEVIKSLNDSDETAFIAVPRCCCQQLW